jgi:uncharacterized protein with HEPN domain
MPKDDTVYLRHMLDMSRKIEALAEGKSREDFDRDEVLAFALTHLVQTVGEAARRVSEETRQKCAEIPWKAIVGMRHRVVHEYMDVDLDMVWDVCTIDVPALAAQLAEICGDSGQA